MRKYIVYILAATTIALTSCASIDMYRLYTVEPTCSYPAMIKNDSVQIEYLTFMDDSSIKVSVTNNTKSKIYVMWGDTYIDNYEITSARDEQEIYPGFSVHTSIFTKSFTHFFEKRDIKKYGYAQHLVSIPIRFDDDLVSYDAMLRMAKNKKTRKKDMASYDAQRHISF